MSVFLRFINSTLTLRIGFCDALYPLHVALDVVSGSRHLHLQLGQQVHLELGADLLQDADLLALDDGRPDAVVDLLT